MKYLLDASSLVLLIKKADVQSTIKSLQDSLILDLTYYELGNVIWKESTLTRFLTPKEGENLGRIAEDVIAKIEHADSEAGAFPKILEIAQNENLSFYDSSYVYSAREKGLALVTEDKGLKAKARKYVEVSTIAALLS